jgi:replication factor A1
MSETQEVLQKLTEAGLSEEDLKEEIKRKEREFRGFITTQGALFLIAKEHGIEIYSHDIDPELYEEVQRDIDYNEFTIPISDLREDLSNIVLLGKISRIFPIREFIRKDGTPGIVGSFLLTDTWGTTKIILWDHHTKIMQTEFFTIGTILRIINGYCKKGLKERLEVHLSKQGKVQIEPEDIPSKTKKGLEEIEIKMVDAGGQSLDKNLVEMKIEDLFNTNGFVKSISGVIKIKELKEFKKENGERSFLLKFLLIDQTNSINVAVWGMQAINILRIIENGMSVKLINIFVDENEFEKRKEIHFTKKSILEII